jgi:general secretion pathway protein I
MRRLPRNTIPAMGKPPEAGFTLIEILVALAILGLALGAVMVGLRNSATGVAAAAAQAEALTVAQSLLAAEGTSLPLGDSQTAGATADGLQWRVITKRWGSVADRQARLIAATWVQVQVTGQGRSVVLTTLLPGPFARGG